MANLKSPDTVYPKDRIYIDAYGDGERKPCIVGYDTSLYAARICNSDYITMQNLEIVNTGRQPLPYRSGLKIECMDYGVSQNIVVNNVTVRDVNGSLVKRKRRRVRYLYSEWR